MEIPSWKQHRLTSLGFEVEKRGDAWSARGKGHGWCFGTTPDEALTTVMLSVIEDYDFATSGTIRV